MPSPSRRYIYGGDKGTGSRAVPGTAQERGEEGLMQPVIMIFGNIFQKKDDAAKGKPAIQLSYTKNGTPMTSFKVSTDREADSRSEDNKLDFWDVTAFGRTAEFLAKYFAAGSPISIVGEISHEKWDSDGKMHEQIKCLSAHFAPRDYSRGKSQAPAQQDVQGQGTYTPQGMPQNQTAYPPQGTPQNQAAYPPQGVVQQQGQNQGMGQQSYPQQGNAQSVPAQPPADPGFGAFTGFEPLFNQGVPGSNGF